MVFSLFCNITGYEARLSAEQPSKKEVMFEINCPGQKSYVVSEFDAFISHCLSLHCSHWTPVNSAVCAISSHNIFPL